MQYEDKNKKYVSAEKKEYTTQPQQEEIATKNGYLGAEETANRLWNSMSSNQLWGKSRLGETFADVINNDLLSPEKLDLFLRATRAYCESKSVEDKGITLIDNIRKYQSSMPEFNALDKKRNNGNELNSEETKKMEDYVRTLGDIEEQFKKFTSSDEAKSRMEKEIIERLGKINLLYGFARNLTHL